MCVRARLLLCGYALQNAIVQFSRNQLGVRPDLANYPLTWGPFKVDHNRLCRIQSYSGHVKVLLAFSFAKCLFTAR